MKNRRGYELDSNGKVLIPSSSETNTRAGAKDEEHRILIEFLAPNLDAQVVDILRETQKLRLLGLLPPFVEGEPIGAYKFRPPFLSIVESPAERWMRKQEELRSLRTRNNRALAQLEKE